MKMRQKLERYGHKPRNTGATKAQRENEGPSPGALGGGTGLTAP